MLNRGLGKMMFGSVQTRNNYCVMGRLGRLLLVFALLWMGGALHAWGQADTGRISGVVKDSSGAVIPNATVVATRVETGENTTAKTDSGGVYTFASLIAGTYNVTVTAQGFSSTANQGYVLSDGSAVTSNFDLKPSGHNEEITVVTATVDQVNTQTGEVSHVIDGDTVRDLALNGRNYLDLLGTLPGSVQAGLGDAISTTTSMTTTNINLNGARATANGLYIDGFLNKDIGSNAAQFNNVGIDFIDHVKVQTSSFSAQYGQAAGPTINVVSRSGTNRIHGTLFEFIRNSAVDATNYFSRNSITYAPIHAHLRYNDFGGAVGGPIIIPHVFDGHDKLFFFIGAEWKLIAQQDQPAVQTLPLQAQVNGIFGTPGACAFTNFTIFVNSQPVTQHLPQSTCDMSPYITAFGRGFQNEMNYVISQATSYQGTACNVALGDCTNNGNTIFELPQPYRIHEYVARVDWTISRRQTAYGRWFDDTHTTTNPIGDGATPVTPYHDEAPANNVLLSHSLVVSQQAVNEISFGALFSSINFQPYGTSWLRSSYDYNYQPYYVNASKVGIPGINLYGFSALDSDSYMNRYHPSYFQLQDIYTLVIARQTLKFGALIGRNRADTNGKANFTGAASFTPTASTNTTGNPIADALLGNFQTYSEAPTDTFGQFRLTSYAAYVDDIWRAASKLSLNFGVRFEHLTPWTAAQDNLSDFYPNLYQPNQAVYVNTLGVITPGLGNVNNGLRRAGTGVPADQASHVPTALLPNTLAVPTSGQRGFYSSQYVFMPRVGFAYDLNGNGQTAFRGGAGLFYDTPQANANFSTLILPPYEPNVNIENGNMDNIASYASNQYPFAAMYTLDPKFQRTYVYQYNFGIQQQMAKDFFLQINYVGAEGRHLLRHPDINGVDPTVEDCVVAAFDAAKQAVPVLDWMRQYTSATLPTNAATAGGVTVPLKGSTACAALPPANSNGYGGYAGYDAIYQWRSDVDYNYNALQANLNRRVGKGRFTLTYTFSKALSTGSADGDVDHIELYSKKYNYGPTSFDRRNVVTSTYIVQVGPLQGHNLVMREALASWMLTGTARYQGGTLNTVSGTDELGVSSRANYCGYPVLYKHTAANWFYTSTPSSATIAGAGLENFTAPTVYTPTSTTAAWKGVPSASPCQGNYIVGVGDAPVGNVLGPNLYDVDISMRKTFELTPRYRLTVNFDSFNVLNHPNFSVPYLNINTVTVPETSAQVPITGAYLGIGSAGRPRNISGGARLYF